MDAGDGGLALPPARVYRVDIIFGLKLINISSETSTLTYGQHGEAGAQGVPVEGHVGSAGSDIVTRWQY